MLTENEISKIVVDSCFKIHEQYGRFNNKLLKLGLAFSRKGAKLERRKN
jgi:hypothetical protein